MTPVAKRGWLFLCPKSSLRCGQAGNLHGKEVRQQPISAVWTENPVLYPRMRQQPERPAAGAYMAFFQSAVGVLQTLVIALGAGLGIWGAINLLEGYGNDNPGANAHVR